METKIEFKATQLSLQQVHNGGDGAIIKSDVDQVFLYPSAANMDSAGRIAVGLLCDSPMRVSSTAMMFVSHPRTELNTVEMVASQWVFENRPSDDSKEILSWLESLGLRNFEARRVLDLFVRFCMWSLFKGIKLEFKSELKLTQ